ncbi:ATP-binding cassette domain-containing protein, partial [bacterium]|nr:ATP-binding cassette domain-containing protein [bacterium]
MEQLAEKIKLQTQNLNLHYGKLHALKNISIDIISNKVTAFIGPSGCGKSSFLKTINRMNDLVPIANIEGRVFYEGIDIYKEYDVIELRKK